MTPRDAAHELEPTPRDLGDLAEKYAEMIRLRRLDASGEPHDPRPALARLAARFPGALREIDDLPFEAVTARLVAVTRAERDPSAREPWMHAMVVYHRLARGALAAKRWLAGAKMVDAPLRVAFTEALAEGRMEPDAAAWADRLHDIAAPPGGRISELAFIEAGARLGLPTQTVRSLVHPPRRELLD